MSVHTCLHSLHGACYCIILLYTDIDLSEVVQISENDCRLEEQGRSKQDPCYASIQNNLHHIHTHTLYVEVLINTHLKFQQDFVQSTGCDQQITEDVDVVPG